jgi:hypothetical protein
MINVPAFEHDLGTELHGGAQTLLATPAQRPLGA